MEIKSEEFFNEDAFLPGKKIPLGKTHPIKEITREIKEIFRELGYISVDSPEIETEDYNFNKLNIPKNHPARKMHDTFYFTSGKLLRTHTSSAQIRILEKNPNIEQKFLIIGPVYRRDVNDATHTSQFTQFEAFAVGKKINFLDLKRTIESFLRKIFKNNEQKIRFRYSYFPFTQPSVEVDVGCVICKSLGCSTCKKSGWLEILGAGLIHPKVLENCKFETKKFSGFAFGLGVERILMLKYGLDDIRDLYKNDLNFLKSF